VGPGADIWGLGATLYHAASGRLPFPRGDNQAVDKGSLRARFPQLYTEPTALPKHLPPALSRLILHMLCKDPDERPVAADVAAALESLVAEGATTRHRGEARHPSSFQ